MNNWIRHFQQIWRRGDLFLSSKQCPFSQLTARSPSAPPAAVHWGRGIPDDGTGIVYDRTRGESTTERDMASRLDRHPLVDQTGFLYQIRLQTHWFWLCRQRQVNAPLSQSSFQYRLHLRTAHIHCPRESPLDGPVWILPCGNRDQTGAAAA
jgi:hypothetical protein